MVVFFIEIGLPTLKLLALMLILVVRQDGTAAYARVIAFCLESV
jgi:hypothetical protein